MARLSHIVLIRLAMLTIFLLPAVSAVAQCPMCKMSAENSNIRGGLNTGILYLLAMPFLLMGGALLYWYFNRKEFGSNQ